MNNKLQHITLCILLVFLAACTADTTCRKDMVVKVNIGLQADSLNTNDKRVLYTKWDSVTVEVIGKQEYLINNGRLLSQLPLYLRPDAEQTAFLITYHEQTDTLYVQHTPRQYFISLACGCAVYHTITHAWSTDTRVDSVEIINASVENAVQENLRIHLHE